MDFNILTEDKSGAAVLEVLIPKIIGDRHRYFIRPFCGLGHIPKGKKRKDLLRMCQNRNALPLLNNLEPLLKEFGRSQKYNARAVIVVCDLDDKDPKAFLEQLTEILDRCDPKPETRFCFAIEESEAWLLGDINAITSAFPNAKKDVLDRYENDSICGTWETLADAIYEGGSKKLSSKPRQTLGAQKSYWAKEIAPHMNVNTNKSPSFIEFRETMRKFCKKHNEII